MEKQLQITFIGAGNMASSIIGLINQGASADSITVTDTLDTQRNQVAAQFGVRAAQDNATASIGADVVVLAVKPNVMQTGKPEKHSHRLHAATVNSRRHSLRQH